MTAHPMTRWQSLGEGLRASSLSIASLLLCTFKLLTVPRALIGWMWRGPIRYWTTHDALITSHRSWTSRSSRYKGASYFVDAHTHLNGFSSQPRAPSFIIWIPLLHLSTNTRTQSAQWLALETPPTVTSVAWVYSVPLSLFAARWPWLPICRTLKLIVPCLRFMDAPPSLLIALSVRARVVLLWSARGKHRSSISPKFRHWHNGWSVTPTLALHAKTLSPPAARPNSAMPRVSNPLDDLLPLLRYHLTRYHPHNLRHIIHTSHHVSLE